VFDATAVDERVRRDRRSDHEAERSGPRRRRANAAYEEHTDGDEDDADPLESGRPLVEEEQACDEDQNRRDAARHRVDDAHLARPVRVREQGEVEQLECARRDRVCVAERLDFPRRRRERSSRGDTDHDRHRRRRLDVVRAGEQDVPAGVQHRGREREQQTAVVKKSA
jgi:hypothetical protein